LKRAQTGEPATAAQLVREIPAHLKPRYLIPGAATIIDQISFNFFTLIKDTPYQVYI